MSAPHPDGLPAAEELLARVAHELRTPLTPILGWCRLIAEKYPNDPSVQRAAGIIERNVRVEARLVDDLLEIVRIERGAVQLDLRPVDLRALGRSVVAEARRSLQEP